MDIKICHINVWELKYETYWNCKYQLNKPILDEGDEVESQPLIIDMEQAFAVTK